MSSRRVWAAPSRWSGHALLRLERSRAALRLGPSGVDRCRGARCTPEPPERAVVRAARALDTTTRHQRTIPSASKAHRPGTTSHHTRSTDDSQIAFDVMSDLSTARVARAPRFFGSPVHALAHTCAHRSIVWINHSTCSTWFRQSKRTAQLVAIPSPEPASLGRTIPPANPSRIRHPAGPHPADQRATMWQARP